MHLICRKIAIIFHSLTHPAATQCCVVHFSLANSTANRGERFSCTLIWQSALIHSSRSIDPPTPRVWCEKWTRKRKRRNKSNKFTQLRCQLSLRWNVTVASKYWVHTEMDQVRARVTESDGELKEERKQEIKEERMKSSIVSQGVKLSFHFDPVTECHLHVSLSSAHVSREWTGCLVYYWIIKWDSERHWNDATSQWTRGVMWIANSEHSWSWRRRAKKKERNSSVHHV